MRCPATSRRSPARRLRVALAAAVVLAPATLAHGSSVNGTWRHLPPAPIAPAFNVVSVWTGKQMLVFGRAQPNPPWSVDVAAAYTPATRTWRRLAPLPGPKGNYEGRYSAVWTGKEMLVFGPFDVQAFNPATGHWRRLPKTVALPGGILVWTGREVIGWGGGCCGDAFSDGVAYNPTTGKLDKLAPAPLAPGQRPIGAWTGHELVLFVGGINPADGKPWPTSLARAAAYNPTTNAWRRIAPLPAVRTDPNAVWDGREVLVVGGKGPSRGAQPATPAAVGLAYDPAANRWRHLPSTPTGRASGAAVWTGSQLLVWGGTTNAVANFKLVTPSAGLAYSPTTNRWSRLPAAPLTGRLEPAAVWTGTALIVWGGYRPATPPGSGWKAFADGAFFTPTTR